MSKIKYIIFDFDGVIVETFKKIFEIMKEAHLDLSEEEYKNMHMGNIYVNLEKNKKDTNLKQEDFFKKYYAKLMKTSINKALKSEIFNLSLKYKLYIITSSLESTVKEYLLKQDILKLFTEVLGYETHKDKSFKFKLLFEKYNFNNLECIFITDTLGDVLEANKLKINTIGVTWGFHEENRLKEGNPIKIIKKQSELSNSIYKISQKT